MPKERDIPSDVLGEGHQYFTKDKLAARMVSEKFFYTITLKCIEHAPNAAGEIDADVGAIKQKTYTKPYSN